MHKRIGEYRGILGYYANCDKIWNVLYYPRKDKTSKFTLHREVGLVEMVRLDKINRKEYKILCKMSIYKIQTIVI